MLENLGGRNLGERQAGPPSNRGVLAGQVVSWGAENDDGWWVAFTSSCGTEHALPPLFRFRVYCVLTSPCNDSSLYRSLRDGRVVSAAGQSRETQTPDVDGYHGFRPTARQWGLYCFKNSRSTLQDRLTTGLISLTNFSSRYTNMVRPSAV